jgi:hypothetical protein
MASGDEPMDVFSVLFSGPCMCRLPSAEAARMRSHVLALAQEHQICVEEKAIHPWDADGSLDPTDRRITVPDVRTELAYFVALHEIAHLMLGLPSFEQPEGSESAVRLYLNEAAASNCQMLWMGK